MRRCRAVVVAVAAAVAIVVVASAPARAAAPWDQRGLVLPRHDFALDLGLGIGHEPVAPSGSITGFGLNLDLAFGIAHHFELGLRLGFRLDDGGQATRADGYGRPFETETYGTDHDHVANPELRFRWSAARGAHAELGVDVRFYLPIEDGSRFGFMVALPVILRAGGVLRVDTGVYLPVIFTDPNTTTIISVPAHVWIQLTHVLWLGPLTGLRVVVQGGSHLEVPLGFGLGASLSRAIDLKTWFLFPDMNRTAAARTWGAGVALQLRFE